MGLQRSVLAHFSRVASGFHLDIIREVDTLRVLVGGQIDQPIDQICDCKQEKCVATGFGDAPCYKYYTQECENVRRYNSDLERKVMLEQHRMY